MKIVVDEMPKKETDCPFSERDGKEPFYYYACRIGKHVCHLNNYDGCPYFKKLKVGEVNDPD